MGILTSIEIEESEIEKHRFPDNRKYILIESQMIERMTQGAEV